MNKNAITIDELVRQTMESMRTLGFTEYSVQMIYGTAMSQMEKYFHHRGKPHYSTDTMEEYRVSVERRLMDGEISKRHYKTLIRAIERVTEVYLTGKLECAIKTRISRFKLNDAFESLRQEYLTSREFGSSKAVRDYSWVIRKYFTYLMEQGHETIDTVEVRDICNFLHFCSDTISPGSLHNVICYTRRFHDFLDEAGRLSIPYKGALSFKVKRGTKIQQPVSADEARRVLEQLDTTSNGGKRHLAMILLGARTGLRAIDIINLRLDDIDWRNGEIRIVQKKTGAPHALRMDSDVINALADYILSVRPPVDSEYVFLTLCSPYRKLNDHVGVQDIWTYYQEKAGIERKPFDGKGFHGLRRLLGRDMAVSGVSAITIAQALGQRNVNSVKQYIALDGVHLKECALDFRGIEILGGAIQ